MTVVTNAENLRKYESRFSLTVKEYWLSLQALIWLEKLRVSFKISNEFHNHVFCVLDKTRF